MSNLTKAQDKYTLLTEKLNKLQNLQLKPPQKIENIDFNLTKFNSNVNKTIQNYTDKANYIQKSIDSLNNLYNSRKDLQNNSQSQLQTQIQNIIKQFSNTLQIQRSQITNKINETFDSISKNLLNIMEQQKLEAEKIYTQIDNLKHIAQNDIPLIYNSNDELNKNNQQNIDSLNIMLQEELNQTKNLIYSNIKLREDSESQFNLMFQEQCNLIKENLINIQNKRLKFEEQMFDDLSKSVEMMKKSLKIND